MKRSILLSVVFLLGFTRPMLADDIDIYINTSSTGGSPYVMLTLDWRPSIFNVLCTYGAGESCEGMMSADSYTNLSARPDGDKVSTFEGFVAVLETILNKSEFDNIYMGLMISNKDDGGAILKGYTQLLTGRSDLITTLKTIPAAVSNADAHKLQPSETYYEWYRYINGGAVINSTDPAVANNFGGNAAAPVPPSYDNTIISGGYYKTPFTDPSACPKLFSILVAMNSANQDDSLDVEIETDMDADAAFKFEGMMEYMHQSDGVDLIGHVDEDQILQKSWVISDGGSIGATRDWSSAGGSGSPLDLTDPEQLEEDLTNAFIEVISVSSTIVAASVPVNVFNRAQSLDNIYIALFEAQSTLRWPGNLKKLKLHDSDNDGLFDEIIDVKGEPGFESTGDDIGRITFDALTYWTDSGELPNIDGEPIGADGRTVDRGGAGQKINGFIEGSAEVIGATNSTSEARQVYLEPSTLTNGSNNALDDFDADTATATALAEDLLGGLAAVTPDLAEIAESEELIKWGRGLDVDDEDGDGDVDDPRPWVLGDAIHSRPLAINYGTADGYSESNPNIRIFMGTNDGLFHIFENTSSGGSETGEEVFAFYPRETLGQISLHRDNAISSKQMRYGVDGTPVALVVDNNSDGTIDASDSDEVYVYFGLRRGGNAYYALNVSDPSATPTLKWKIAQTVSGAFDELGMTFSTPVVGKVRYGSTPTDVLIFAGGYNGGWDLSYTNRVGKDAGDADDTVGNAIYIVNARTGELIWKVAGDTSTGSSANSSADTGYSYTHADMVDSIPAQVTVLKNRSGIVHRLYVGDTGGAIWRVDLPEVSSGSEVDSKWFATKFAELGTDGATTDRRFFEAADIVETRDLNGNFDGLLINSGNRADPTETDVSNYLYYLKDRNIASGDTTIKTRLTLDMSSLHDQTACVDGTELGCGSDSDIYNGWKIELARSGEKGLSKPLVDSGRVFFTSYLPATSVSVCGLDEGQGSVYVVNLSDGTAVYNNGRYYDLGAGIPAGAVAIGDVIILPGGGADFGDVDGDGIGDGRGKLLPSGGGKLWRYYWREPGIDDL